MPRRNLAWLLGIAAVALFGLAVSHSAPSREKDRDYELVRLVVDVLHEVRHKYVTDVDPERERKLVEDMINGGLERLDPHSQYINPHEYKQFDEEEQGQVRRRRHPGRLRPPEPRRAVGHQPDARHPRLRRRHPGRRPHRQDRRQIDRQHAPQRGRGPDPGRPRREDHPDRAARGRQGAGRHPHRPRRDPGAGRHGRSPQGRQPEGVGILHRPGEQDRLHPPDGVQRDGGPGAEGRGRRSCRSRGCAAWCSTCATIRAGCCGRPSRSATCSSPRAGSSAPRAATTRTRSTRPSPTTPSCRPRSARSRSSSTATAPAPARSCRPACRTTTGPIIVGERSYGKGSVQNVIEMKEGDETAALKLTTASYWRPSGKNIHRFPDTKESDEWGVKPNDGFEVKLTDEERLDYLHRPQPARHRPRQGRHAEPPKEDKDKEQEEAVRGPRAEQGAGVSPRRDQEAGRARKGERITHPFLRRFVEPRASNADTPSPESPCRRSRSGSAPSAPHSAASARPCRA